MIGDSFDSQVEALQDKCVIRCILEFQLVGNVVAEIELWLYVCRSVRIPMFAVVATL